MNDNKMPKPNLPTIDVRKGELDNAIQLFAAYQAIDSLNEYPMSRRLEAIPHAKQGVAMMLGRLDQLIVDILGTMPRSKGSKLIRMAKVTRYKTVTDIRGIKEDNEVLVKSSDLDIITKRASAWCEMCVDGKCNRCDLGKCFDEVLSYDRQRDESWSTIFAIGKN